MKILRFLGWVMTGLFFLWLAYILGFVSEFPNQPSFWGWLGFYLFIAILLFCGIVSFWRAIHHLRRKGNLSAQQTQP